MAGLRSYRDVAGSIGRTQPVTEPSRKHRPDYWLLILAIALLGIGMIVVYAISPALGAAQGVDSGHIVSRQAIAVALGVVSFAIASRIPLDMWRRFCIPLLIFAGIATLWALVTPVDARYPAPRWIRLGGFSFQSVELLKFAFLIWLAGFLAVRVRTGKIAAFRPTIRPLLAVLVVLGIVVAGLQRDLGSMAVITAMIGLMIFVAGLPVRWLAMGAAVVLVLGTLFISSTPYRRERLATFMDQSANCQKEDFKNDEGFQVCQALISIGSGGTVGLGLGRSVQAYGYQPEAANDSIFAIYAEKFGFVGVLVLLTLLAALFSRLKSLAERAPDDFSRLFVIGVLSWLSVQAMINIGGMLGLIPLKGITLPLVSYGGTSVIFVLAALGIVFNISRFTSYAPAGNPSAPTTDNRRRAMNRHSMERSRAGTDG